MSTREQIVADQGPITAETAPAETGIEADSLVEEVSIDGMCGVY